MTKNNQSNVTPITPEVRQELCALYQNAADNLAALKKSQWQVFVFFSVVVAFLITLANDKLPNTKNDVFDFNTKVGISIALFIGAIVAVFMLRWYLKKSMSEERAVLHNIYKHFSPLFRKCRSPKGDVRASDFFEKWIIKWGGTSYIGIIFAFTMYNFWKDYVLCFGTFIYVLSSPLCIDKLINRIKRKQALPKKTDFARFEAGRRNETSAKLEKLPDGVEFPEDLQNKIRYDAPRKLLIFKGVMTKDEKGKLLSLSEDDSYQKAIEALFQRSKDYIKWKERIKAFFDP